MLIGIVCAIIIAVFLFYLIAKKRFSKLSKLARQDDSAAQNLYNKLKHGEDEVSLTLQERVELSWQFLYKLTEKITNEFSKEDQREINEAGRMLINNGMTYQHMVDDEITPQVIASLGHAKKQQTREI